MERKKKSEEVYRLHIDATPHHSKVESKTVIHKASAHPAVTHHKPLPAKKPPSRIWTAIWDKLEFVAVSVGVFLVIYVGLNWQALSANAVQYYNEWRGYVSPLEKLTAEGKKDPEKLATVDLRGSSQIVIPPLKMEVFPTDMRVVIPRINQNVPVVGVKNENLINRKWDQLESDIQGALRNGVVHYPGTALPGDNGNVVLTGHSSYYAWDPGRFKDVFSLLHNVKLEDKVVVYFNQKKYIYQVEDIKVVLPQFVDVLGQTDHEQLTLITCTPIGTNLKRLVITARLVEKS